MQSQLLDNTFCARFSNAPSSNSYFKFNLDVKLSFRFKCKVNSWKIPFVPDCQSHPLQMLSNFKVLPQDLKILVQTQMHPFPLFCPTRFSEAISQPRIRLEQRHLRVYNVLARPNFVIFQSIIFWNICRHLVVYNVQCTLSYFNLQICEVHCGYVKTLLAMRLPT